MKSEVKQNWTYGSVEVKNQVRAYLLGRFSEGEVGGGGKGGGQPQGDLISAMRSILESLLVDSEKRGHEELKQIVMNCLMQYRELHGECSRSEIEEIVEVLKDIQTTAHNLTEGRANDQRRLFEFPLLAELSEYHSTGRKGWFFSLFAKKIYRVHFLCAVCGQRPVLADVEKGYQKGYRLVLHTGWTKHLLFAFKISMVLTQIALLAFGIHIPDEMIKLCSSALGNIRILDHDTISGLRSIMTEAEIKSLNEDFLSATQPHRPSNDARTSFEVAKNPIAGSINTIDQGLQISENPWIASNISALSRSTGYCFLNINKQC